MRYKLFYSGILLALAICLTLIGAAKTGDGKDKDKDAVTTTMAANHAAQDDPMRLEGERRFHSNCGRCHAAPPKFSARMTGTIIRHMRVRATITDEDMRSILHYMTQ